MKNKLYLILMIMLLSIPLAFADVNYTESGDGDNFYTRGSAIFNSGVDPDTLTVSTRVLSDPKKVPLISDLNNDGIVEIVVLNGETIIIFQNKTIDIADTFLLNAPSGERFSNMLLFDIDGDSENEIILAGEKRNLLHILNYSSETGVAEQTIINMTGIITHTINESAFSESGLMTIGCSAENRCLIAYSENQTTQSGDGTGHNSNLFASFFNSTNIANEIFLDIADGGAFNVHTHCPPKIRHMAKADYDEDGSTEFIFTFSEPNMNTGDSGDDVNIFWVDILTNNTPVKEFQTFTTEVDEIFTRVTGGVTFSCDDGNNNNEFTAGGFFGDPLPGKYFTSPLVYNADPSTAGLETIIGVQTVPDNFIMIMYDQTGSEIREFPLTLDSEGQLISNVFRAEAFDDSTGDSDFCIMAQQSTGDEEIIVTCGSLTDGDGFGLFNLQTIEFRSNNTFGVPFNISDDFDFHGIMAHSIETDQTNSEDEVLSSYGILRLDFTGAFCSLANNCELSQIFANPRENGVVISTDLDKIDQEDLIVMTSSNLFYIDDGFENQPVNIFCGEANSVVGVCSQFTTNPCIDSVWKLNTTVEITVTAIDSESDQVSTRVILYDGDSNEDDSGFTANVSSGTTVPFTFTANKSIANGVLTIEAKDSENQETVRTVTKTFSVAPAGVEFNDCVSTFETGVIGVDGVEDGIITNATLTEDATENAISTAIVEVSFLSGLSGTTFWLILMIAFSVAIYFRGAQINWPMNTILGAIAVINTLFIILGARLGILSTGLVVIIVILGVVIIATFIGKFITGVNNTQQ